MILLVLAATKIRVSSGSNIYCQSSGNLPSLVPGYGFCGLIGQSGLSKTHRDRKPAFSACFARYTIFSFVARLLPVCGSLSPICILKVPCLLLFLFIYTEFRTHLCYSMLANTS